MAIYALWSAPRARSTAFFRSMLERGDLVMSHEPFSDLAALGETDVGGRTFRTTRSFADWLRAVSDTTDVFLKDTPDRRHEWLFEDPWYLTEVRHAFLIRRPEEIAASFRAIEPTMTVDSLGLANLHRFHAAVGRAVDRAAADRLAVNRVAADRAPGDRWSRAPVVIDSDDLVDRPAATMAAYCNAVGLPFRPSALRWEAGPRPEWRRSERWHRDVGASTGLGRRDRRYAETVENSADLARFADHHRPFYDALHRCRLPVPPGPDAPAERGGGR